MGQGGGLFLAPPEENSVFSRNDRAPNAIIMAVPQCPREASSRNECPTPRNSWRHRWALWRHSLAGHARDVASRGIKGCPVPPGVKRERGRVPMPTPAPWKARSVPGHHQSGRAWAPHRTDWGRLGRVASFVIWERGQWCSFVLFFAFYDWGECGLVWCRLYRLFYRTSSLIGLVFRLVGWFSHYHYDSISLKCPVLDRGIPYLTRTFCLISETASDAASYLAYFLR